MTLNLDDLEAIARAATPGPWQHLPYGGQNQNGDYSGGEIYEANGEHLISDVSDEAGSHIATFDPPTVLALIAKLREAEAVIEKLMDASQRVEGGPIPWVEIDTHDWDAALATYKHTNQEKGGEA